MSAEVRSSISFLADAAPVCMRQRIAYGKRSVANNGKQLLQQLCSVTLSSRHWSAFLAGWWGFFEVHISLLWFSHLVYIEPCSIIQLSNFHNALFPHKQYKHIIHYLRNYGLMYNCRTQKAIDIVLSESGWPFFAEATQGLLLKKFKSTLVYYGFPISSV